LPDYKKGVPISLPYTAQQNGWIFCCAWGRAFYLAVNGQIVYKHAINPDMYDSAFIPINQGDTIIIAYRDDNSYGYQTMFYPCK
jgi:hypothetical protein